MSEILRRDPFVTCQWYETPEVFESPGRGCDHCEEEPEDGGGGRLICTELCTGYHCGVVSAFVVERSDGDKSFGWDGRHETCEVHLVAVIDGMLSGDEKLHAVVHPRWHDLSEVR